MTKEVFQSKLKLRTHNRRKISTRRDNVYIASQGYKVARWKGDYFAWSDNVEKLFSTKIQLLDYLEKHNIKVFRPSSISDQEEKKNEKVIISINVCVKLHTHWMQ